MPELTPIDYVFVPTLATIIAVIICAIVWRRRKIREEKKAYISFLVRRILTRKILQEKLPTLASRSEAVKYATAVFYEFRLQYAASNGDLFVSNPIRTCEMLVDKLCELEIIPKKVYSKWR